MWDVPLYWRHERWMYAHVADTSLYCPSWNLRPFAFPKLLGRWIRLDCILNRSCWHRFQRSISFRIKSEEKENKSKKQNIGRSQYRAKFKLILVSICPCQRFLRYPLDLTTDSGWYSSAILSASSGCEALWSYLYTSDPNLWIGNRVVVELF